MELLDLDNYRQITDSLADTLINNLASEGENMRGLMQSLIDNPNPDKSYPDALAQFLASNAQLPAFANIRKIKEGMRFFNAHYPDIMMLLGIYSLPYCYAASNGARVLAATGRLTETSLKRLKETGAFVLAIGQGGLLTPEGRQQIVKTRLIHSLVRHMVHAHNPIFDTNAWGQPVNQEDMAGTNLSFSVLILRGLRKFGITILPSAAESWHHLWRVTGSLLGLMPTLNPETLADATQLAETIEVRQHASSDHGKALMAALLDAFAFAFQGQSSFANFQSLVPDLVTYMLGPDIAPLVGLPAQPKDLNNVKIWLIGKKVFPSVLLPLPPQYLYNAL